MGFLLAASPVTSLFFLEVMATTPAQHVLIRVRAVPDALVTSLWHVSREVTAELRSPHPWRQITDLALSFSRLVMKLELVSRNS